MSHSTIFLLLMLLNIVVVMLNVIVVMFGSRTSHRLDELWQMGSDSSLRLSDLKEVLEKLQKAIDAQTGLLQFYSKYLKERI